MTNQLNYWVSFIQGMFWKWKTFLAFANLYSEIINDRDKYHVVSNIPYSFVDTFISSRQDLLNFLRLLADFIEATNTDIKSTFYAESKTIYIILDEVQNLFPARWFSSWQIDDIIIQLTQCRKRSVKFIMITQKPWLVDKTFRILADYTINMERMNIPFFDIYKAYYYDNPWDIIDINTNIAMIDSWDWWFKSPDAIIEQMSLIKSEIFRPLSDIFNVFVRFSWWYHVLSEEEYNTKYVTWYSDANRQTLPTMHSYHTTDYLINFVDDIYYWEPPHIIRPSIPPKPKPKWEYRQWPNYKDKEIIWSIVEQILPPVAEKNSEYVPSFRSRWLSFSNLKHA